MLKCGFVITSKIIGSDFYISQKINTSACTYLFKKVTNSKFWSVLFFGSDNFSLESLKILHDSYKKNNSISNLEVVSTLHQKANPVCNYAKKNNIPLNEWPLTRLPENKFDIGIVVSFGHLIPENVIKLFPLGIINVHSSLLPRWRGAAPICHTLMNGDVCTGVSIMKIVPKRFDVGDIILQEKTDIHPDETYIDLYDKLSKLGAAVLLKTILQLPNILNESKPQIEENATYAPKITRNTSFVKWNLMNAKQIYDLQRSLTGLHPLRTTFKNQTIKILNVKPVTPHNPPVVVHKKVPGLVTYDKNLKKLFILCQGESWITVETIVIPGHRPLSKEEFSAGYIYNTKEKYCLFS